MLFLALSATSGENSKPAKHLFLLQGGKEHLLPDVSGIRCFWELGSGRLGDRRSKFRSRLVGGRDGVVVDWGVPGEDDFWFEKDMIEVELAYSRRGLKGAGNKIEVCRIVNIILTE